MMSTLQESSVSTTATTATNETATATAITTTTTTTATYEEAAAAAAGDSMVVSAMSKRVTMSDVVSQTTSRSTPVPHHPLAGAPASPKAIAASESVTAMRRASAGTFVLYNEERAPLYDPSLPHVEHIEGPVMLTAPHGLELFRGGSLGERTRVHYRERWVSEIVLKLSQSIAKKLGSVMGSTSFVVWNCATARKQDPANLDPNYLPLEDLERSPWHRALKRWRDTFAGTGVPLLHIDVHGKMDRKEDLNIDVGTGAMQELWGDRDITHKLKKAAADQLEKALEGRRLYGYKQLRMGVEREPVLRGYNTRGFHTMAHQSVLLGIPALQLELPKTVRKALLVENLFFERFTDAIVGTYLKAFGKVVIGAADIPPHYPPSFRRQLEQIQEEKQAAKERKAAAKGKGRIAAAAALYAAVAPPPAPAKLTRAAALSRQLLSDLDYYSTVCEDRMI